LFKHAREQGGPNVDGPFHPPQALPTARKEGKENGFDAERRKPLAVLATGGTVTRMRGATILYFSPGHLVRGRDGNKLV